MVLGAAPAFLDRSAGDWRACLLASLAYVRQSWDGQRAGSGDGERGGRWVGLPALVDACAHFLELSDLAPNATSAKLLAVAREVAAQMEAEMAAAMEGELENGLDAESGGGAASAEPRYHNRLHFSDSLTTITLQAAIEIEHSGADDADWKAALVLMALAHDFRHTGGVNRVPAEIEQHSYDALKPYLLQHAVPALWVERIEAVILRSDFSGVADNHRRVAGQPFSWCTDWAAVLLNEADIMASASSEYGPGLGHALALEWERIQFPAYQSVATAQGRIAFLQSLEFSSYSAGVLGAADKVRQQLAGASVPDPQSQPKS
jgi:hypothetical protein